MSGTPWYASQIDKLAKEKKELEAQRDELFEALKRVLEFGTDTNTNRGSYSVRKALAAIAKAEGGE